MPKWIAHNLVEETASHPIWRSPKNLKKIYLFRISYHAFHLWNAVSLFCYSSLSVQCNSITRDPYVSKCYMLHCSDFCYSEETNLPACYAIVQKIAIRIRIIIKKCLAQSMLLPYTNILTLISRRQMNIN